MSHEFSDELMKASGVRRDWVDLRDQTYLPSLSVLRETFSMDPRIAPADADTGIRKPVFGVRHQGDTGRCVGFALANLIDIQRNLQRFRGGGVEIDPNADGIAQKPEVVSADMLYRMAYFHDRYPETEEEYAAKGEGVRTLRSGIKGFYHHGACLDWPDTALCHDPGRWQSTAYNAYSLDRERWFPTVDQAKRAREIGLGAYFRLASVLNHYHTALNEAEAVLVSANVHDGWQFAIPENDGKIAWPPARGILGTHAFVLTGYDQHGFHVLNSWGDTWGGYQKQAGIALWRYEDWAQNIIDGWVLRLGVKAPSAFGVSVGEQGTKGMFGPVQTGSTPCFELVGHYMHLDDGYHVSTGSYPSFKKGWTKTRKHLVTQLDPDSDPDALNQSEYRGLLIWLPGSLEGIKPAFAAAVKRKAAIKSLGLYPYTIFWCNSFVEKSLEVLEIIFKSCQKQAGEGALHLDNLIEQRVQGVGRAFWRDIELAARRALRGTGELPYEADDPPPPEHRDGRGYVAEFLADVARIRAETGCEVHLVAEGAGALVVHEMLSFIKEDLEETPAKDRIFNVKEIHDLFDSLHLVHPAIGLPRARKVLLPQIEAMNGKITGKPNRAGSRQLPDVQPLLSSKACPRARLYIPKPALEKTIGFGSYGKSILHLVSRAFEDRTPAPEGATDDITQLGTPRTFLGMAEVANDKDFPVPGAVYRLNRIEQQLHANDRISQTELNRDPTITNSIFEAIRTLRSSN